VCRIPVTPLLNGLGALRSPRYCTLDAWLARNALRLAKVYVIPPMRSVAIRIARASPPNLSRWLPWMLLSESTNDSE
jgi:hypothetical protein